jgi:molybdate transport system substrate-binding protein
LRRIATPVLAFLAVAALLAGCGRGNESVPAGSSGSASSSSAASVTGTINVFAAASLEEAFTKLGSQFEQKNAGTKVVFNFGPSSGLGQQITAGAPADVFASASTKTMDDVVNSGDAAAPTDFAGNTMEMAVPPGNPAGVKSVNDLANESVKVALCDVDVPCGVVAQQVFDNAGIKVTPVTREVDVRAVLSKVSLGEVDAGVVYVTDVDAAGKDVEGVEIPADVNASTTYPIAKLTGSKNNATAQAFVDYVLSLDGALALKEAGFSVS